MSEPKDLCPFGDDDFVLDVDTPCPVCGMLGSFIYDHPSDDSCVGVFKKAASSGNGEAK